MSGPWPAPVQVVEPIKLGYWPFVRQLLRLAKGADAIVLRGTSGFSEGYVEAVAALMIKLRYRDPPLVLVSDASWDITSQGLERRLPAALRPLLPRLGRWAVHLADGRHVVYCVLSTDEQRLFNQRWGIDGARVRFTPYFASLPTQLVASASDDGYIFAGGNTNRDYGLLVEAAEDLDFPVRIASSWKPSRRLPDNVTVNWLPHDDYNRAMAGASLVVVPLYETARSVGQQTYLSAMLLGKPVIVTDAPGVRDYLQPGETAHVVDRDPVALRAAIDWVLDPGNRASVQAMTERARKAVDEKYLRSHYFSRLWQAAAEEVVSRSH